MENKEFTVDRLEIQRFIQRVMQVGREEFKWQPEQTVCVVGVAKQMLFEQMGITEEKMSRAQEEN